MPAKKKPMNPPYEPLDDQRHDLVFFRFKCSSHGWQMACGKSNCGHSECAVIRKNLCPVCVISHARSR